MAVPALGLLFLPNILCLNCPPLSSPSCPTHLEQTPPVFVQFFIKVHKGSHIIYINTRLAVQGPVLSFDAAWNSCQHIKTRGVVFTIWRGC